MNGGHGVTEERSYFKGQENCVAAENHEFEVMKQSVSVSDKIQSYKCNTCDKLFKDCEGVEGHMTMYKETQAKLSLSPVTLQMH